MTPQIDEKQIKEAADKMMKDGYTLRELKGLTDGEMEAIYSLGFNFYNTGRYDNAEKVFNFLVMFDHMNPKYWIGLGAVQQVAKQYDQAVVSYAYASFLNLHNPQPQYLSAECYLAKGDRDNAQSALEALKQYADPKTEEGKLYLEKGKALEERIAAVSSL